MGFQRDNVLDSSERATSARKCIGLLAGLSPDNLRGKDGDFLSKHRRLSGNLTYAPSEPELQWLRDLVERYVTS